MALGRDSLVVGLTGSFGSGCSTLGTALSRHFGFQACSLSEPIYEEWERRGGKREDAKRRHLQDIGNELRHTKGLDFLARETLKRINRSMKADRIVVDSLRNSHEVNFFRDGFRNFFLVAVLCPQPKRWERLRDGYMALGQSEKDFWEDDLRDQIEEVPYGQQVQLCVDDADMVFSNEETHATALAAQSALAGVLENYVALITGKQPIAPTPDELIMTIAYTQARRSMCLKRHVGAVITDGDGNVIATGFNDNPDSMGPCYKEFSYCYKDSQMSRFLEGETCPTCQGVLPLLIEPFRCPSCNYSLKQHYFSDRGMRWCTALHAEERALGNASGQDLTDAYLYSTTFPCFNCARQIAQAGLTKVIYVEPYPQIDGLWFLPRNGVEVSQFQGVKARAFERLFSRFRAAMEQRYGFKGG